MAVKYSRSVSWHGWYTTRTASTRMWHEGLHSLNPATSGARVSRGCSSFPRSLTPHSLIPSMRRDRPGLAAHGLDRRDRTSYMLGLALREELRREALRLTDPLHLDRDRLDRLLHALQPGARLEVERRRALPTAQDPPRERV